MKKKLLELLICPQCLPEEHGLQVEIREELSEDIIDGNLSCLKCRGSYPISDGIANLDPDSKGSGQNNTYETDELVASYLWSHYGELLNDRHASNAYSVWAEQLQPHEGIALDAGGAVGRFAFEMTGRAEFSIGLDNSVAFIRTARQLMNERQMTISLKDEGFLRKEVTFILPGRWKSDKVEFIVANALALPFRAKSISSISSLNLIDKVPSPTQHLAEMNRVARNRWAQFILSDPFSWSTECTPVQEWLGGHIEGRYSGKGIENIASMLTEDEGPLSPPWRVTSPASVWWKIRTHSNHYELIRSCYILAHR
ncbi:methyltransferase domain-containing protein [Desulfosediminicola sp.]|uniref:methyltransferase domain-containing protein n=1 Tax=Desulfosediminicola sp. TaxID=2886825 RepID=UPI003AF225F0